LETAQDRYMVTVEDLIGNCVWSIKCCHYQWPWVTFKVTSATWCF